MYDLMTRYRLRSSLAFSLPAFGCWLALEMFTTPGASRIGGAIAGGGFFLLSVVLGLGFAIDAVSEGETPKGLAAAAVVMNVVLLLGVATLWVAAQKCIQAECETSS